VARLGVYQFAAQTLWAVASVVRGLSVEHLQQSERIPTLNEWNESDSLVAAVLLTKQVDLCLFAESAEILMQNISSALGVKKATTRTLE
jgi:hypothetical protein